MIKINYPQDRKIFHQNYIKELEISTDIRKKFYKLMCNTSLKRYDVNSLDYILLAPFEELTKVSSYDSLTDKEKGNLKLILDYNKLQPKIKSFFEKNLDIKTCYFCNLDFVNAFEDRDDYHDLEDFIKRASEEDLMKLHGIGKVKAAKIKSERADFANSRIIQKLLDKYDKIELDKKYSHFTLDHVMDKTTHPLLALSLYNFVPSCYSCNSKFKGSNKIITDISSSYLSPTSKDFGVEENVKFKLYFHNRNNIIDIKHINDFVVDFSYNSNESKYKKYIETFKLKGRYIFHKDEVVKLVNKKKRYSNTQLQEIANITKTSLEQIKKDIFGKELFKKNLESMSMCKFKQDIALDIGIK